MLTLSPIEKKLTEANTTVKVYKSVFTEGDDNYLDKAFGYQRALKDLSKQASELNTILEHYLACDPSIENIIMVDKALAQFSKVATSLISTMEKSKYIKGFKTNLEKFSSIVEHIKVKAVAIEKHAGNMNRKRIVASTKQSIAKKFTAKDFELYTQTD